MAGVFGAMLANPGEMIGWMLVVVLIGFAVCSFGLQKGVERVTKVMMVALLGVMAILVVRSVTLPGAAAGLEFYLLPDFGKMFEGGLAGFGDAVYAAMGQAFFTLSLGISAMEVFGSRIGKKHSPHRRGRCASVAWTPWWPSWPASSSSRRASPSPLRPIRGRRWCSSRCPTCSSRCRWGSCGARCSSCS